MINFIVGMIKMINNIDVVNEMYDDNVLDDDDIEELNLNKEKDDFER